MFLQLDNLAAAFFSAKILFFFFSDSIFRTQRPYCSQRPFRSQRRYRSQRPVVLSARINLSARIVLHDRIVLSVRIVLATVSSQWLYRIGDCIILSGYSKHRIASWYSQYIQGQTAVERSRVLSVDSMISSLVAISFHSDRIAPSVLYFPQQSYCPYWAIMIIGLDWILHIYYRTYSKALWVWSISTFDV